MDRIAQAHAALEQAKQDLASAVQDARRHGRTWADIGETLGMTRQAAFKRFGHVVNPVTGHTLTGALMSIDQVRALTERVFELISTGDLETLESLLHPDVRSELPASLIAETWTRVLTEAGALESQSDIHVVLPGGARIDEDEHVLGTVVGVTTLNCEADEVMGRVAVDEQLRIVGLLIVSPDQTPLPF